MMTANCIRHSELPHTTRLFADLVYQFDRVRSFYAHPPYSFQSFQAAAAQVEMDPERRARLVEALRHENSGAGPAALNNLDRLSQRGTFVVASGQQVGFYGGPILTVYKALSAARLAAELTARGIPAVPVFWLATEDHDLGEVNHAWVFDAANQPIRLEAGASAALNQPVGRIRLTNAARERLAGALANHRFGAEVTQLATETYGEGATFGSGFKALLGRLLSAYGILQLDPMAPEIRRLAAPLVRRAIGAAGELTPALLERGRELHDAGYHVQVHVEEATSLFFLLEDGRRTALRRTAETYAGNGRRHSGEELLARLEHEPEGFSPNVLLRPVVQDFLLPTVAYVGGPAELAYLAQSEVIYRRLLGRMPVALPRACFTILDARSEKLLRRYGLSVTDALEGLAALEQRVANALIPEGLQASFAAGHEQIETALGAVEERLLAFDPTLAAAWSTSRRKMLYQFSKVRAKAGRQILRRTARAQADAAYLQHMICPEKTLQERVYSVLPFLARHGLELVDRIHGAIQFECPDHQVLVV